MVFSQFRSKLLRHELRPVGVVVGLLLAFLLSNASDWRCGWDDYSLNVSTSKVTATFNLEQPTQRANDFEKDKNQTSNFLAAQLAGLNDQTCWRVPDCLLPAPHALFFSLTELGIRLQI